MKTIKDSKNKEKFQMSRSIQNLSYLIPSSNSQIAASLYSVAKDNDIQKYEHVFDTQFDEDAKKHFLKTEHNKNRSQKNSKSYRSPYTNRFFPQCEDPSYPPPLVRSIEEKGMLLFSQYAKLYYGDCIANFFVEENQEQLNLAFYVQKKYEEKGSTGVWNSTNITEIKGDPSKSISYKITTSVIYEITYEEKEGQPFTLFGNLRKTKTDNKKILGDCQVDEFHLINVGKLVQENETFLRQQVESVFIRKTEQIIEKTRISETNEKVESRKAAFMNLLQEGSSSLNK